VPGTRRRPEVAILVVDDDCYVRDLVGRILEAGDARVVRAADATAARTAAAEQAFSLAIVNVGLPEGCDYGYTLAADLRGIQAERGQPLPVVALTAQVPDLAAVAASGIVAIVQKPFRIALLQQVVERHLDRCPGPPDTRVIAAARAPTGRAGRSATPLASRSRQPAPSGALDGA
jgi:CheY-like chemotaxis protein